MAIPAKRLGLSTEFSSYLGTFHAAWSSAELTVDYMIHKLLRISRLQAHHLLAGMEIGRKMRLLDGLLARSDLKNKAELLGGLRKMQNDSMRNVFAHSYIWSDEHYVKFINRRSGGRYEAKEHSFTMIKFRMHVEEFVVTGNNFYTSLAIDYDDLQKFAAAALRASRSSKRSPKPPKSKA
jgi:hypothetical protein